MKYDRALIIDEPWISKVLSGEKPLEMRSRHTKIRGRIGLIRKGLGLIVGEVTLCDSVKLGRPQLHRWGHCIDYKSNPELAKYNVAWVMKDPEKYDTPKPYTHKQGAVVWVKV